MMSQNFEQYGVKWRDFFFLSLTVCVLRLPSLFVPYYNIDEITNALTANFINRGELLPKDFLGNTYFLTHFLYAWTERVSGGFNLLPVHGVNILFMMLTTSVLIYTAGVMTGSRVGGLGAGLSFVMMSSSFLAKDFHAALSEGFSLLPATLSVCFLLVNLKREGSFWFFFLSGVMCALASLFKAPMGIMMLPALQLLCTARVQGRIFALILYLLGFVMVYICILAYAGPLPDSIGKFMAQLHETTSGYMSRYTTLSPAYWVSKFAIRSLLVVLASLPVWYFAIMSLRFVWCAPLHIFLAGKAWFAKIKSLPKNQDLQNIQKECSYEWKCRRFLSLFLLCSWLVIPLGKRVFFHYFIFLIPSVCLLASFSIRDKIEAIRSALHFKKGFRFLTSVLLIGFMSLVTFESDAVFRWSVSKYDLPNVVQKIKELSKSGDRIFVWGLVPQLYFFSERLPASTFFWADTLAGLSPGSPAMEYLRSTGQNLSIAAMTVMDMSRRQNQVVTPETIAHHDLSKLKANELLDYAEILDLISDPNWRKVLADFFKSPPKLILDTAATDIRGFGEHSLSRFELLHQFVKDNYKVIETVDNIVIYQLLSTTN